MRTLKAIEEYNAGNPGVNLSTIWDTAKAEIAELKDKLDNAIANLASKDLEVARLTKTITKRNALITDLRGQINTESKSNKELHARIDLLEDIIKLAGLEEYYHEGCYEYHRGNRRKYLERCPKII